MRPPNSVWKRPTRRTFVAMLGAAAAALAIKPRDRKPDGKPAKPVVATRWIGHV